ncbi:YbaB/EbfC family nucleoid-associated protein [Actinoallomurus purpureus]|uniref:YbaB/EbfC family nucleoid-associated protein n=1 Tax=Actinoallomurus purpureus TaxID=478114 RepID=UPI002091E5A7|nr:YbaB/EbfC family nucleoid-associated protein [Actinoallomurus purpureus]MCO6006302.1 YbaB/EbfC family nucleoid-associated protein [Actinoallomurus purpureus]
MGEWSKKSSRLLETKLISRGDDKEIVVATANGLGELLKLVIAERALDYPYGIDDRITMAINRARAAGREFGKRFDELKYPALRTLRSLGDSIFDASIYESYDYVDYSDSQNTRNIIAECSEVLQSMARAAESFDGKFVRREIGSGFGYIETNLADTRVTVKLHPSSLKKIGVDRLADQVVRELSNAQSEARRIRLQSLQDFALWWRRQAPASFDMKG